MNLFEYEVVGEVLFTNLAGQPVHTDLTAEDVFNIAEMQNAEENPMLRSIAA